MNEETLKALSDLLGPADRPIDVARERDFFRRLLAILTDLAVEQDGRLSDASLESINAAIATLADQEAALIRMAGKRQDPPARPVDREPEPQAVTAQMSSERRGAGRSTLAQVPLLQGVDPLALATLQQKCAFRDLGAGEMLLAIGHANDSVYIILSGSVRVHLDQIDGPPYIVLGVGECVGEISTLGQTHATAYVVGHEPARLMVISQPLLWVLTDESPEFARNLLYTLSHRLRRDNQFLRRSMRRQRETERHANLDPLTGLNNRRSLNDRFAHAMRENLEQGRPLTFLMIDVDHFKRFNDTHGHLLGDEVLCALAGVLSENIIDGIAARYGGEEFAVVLPGQGVEQARQRAEAIQAQLLKIELRSPLGQVLPPVTVSIGVAEMGAEDSLQSLIHAADTALYCAKRQGRNCVVAFDPAMAEAPVTPRKRL